MTLREAALRIEREARGPATGRIVERDEGGGGACHCRKDNLHVAHLETFNWLPIVELTGAARTIPRATREGL